MVIARLLISRVVLIAILISCSYQLIRLITGLIRDIMVFSPC
jgi:hypothetical protein